MTASRQRGALAERVECQAGASDALRVVDNRSQAIAQRQLIESLHSGPRTQNMVALQKMANDSAQSLSAGVVQRHRVLGADDYDLGEVSDSQHFFTTQSIEPSLKKRKGAEYKISHDIDRTDDQQDLLISDDASMAINHTSAHAKEFYATDTVFNSAQEKLEQVNSQVKLKKNGDLNLTAEDQTLSKIVPEEAVSEGGEQQNEFADLISHICIEMASGVMGSDSGYDHEAVFQKPGDESETVVNISSAPDRGDSGIEKLATGLVDSPQKVDPKAIRNNMLTGESEELPGKRYGINAGKKQFNKKARQMGINQHARPDVGEGYATFSLAGAKGKQVDYLQTGQEREVLKSIWGYHFATVVARSVDGKDSVTLENYNRADDIYGQLQKVTDRLILSNGHIFRDIRDQVAPVKGESRYETQMKLTKALHLARKIPEDRAQGDFLKILASYNARESWFFAMQGSSKGQSFHEQQAASDAFVNPMTLRVRPRDKSREEARKKGIADLNRHPTPPSLLAGQSAFGEHAKAKSAIIATIERAESTEDVQAAVNDGKDQLAAYAISQAIAAVEACATGSGVGNFGKKARVVAQTLGIKEKASSAIELATQAYSDVEDQIQKLWVFEVEKHMVYSMNQAIVFSAVEFLRSVRAFQDE